MLFNFPIMFLMAGIPKLYLTTNVYPRSLGTTACILISEDDNFCCKFLPPINFIYELEIFIMILLKIDWKLFQILFTVITIAQTILCMISTIKFFKTFLQNNIDKHTITMLLI